MNVGSFVTVPFPVGTPTLPERPAEASSFDIRGVIGFLRRRAGLIASIFVAVVAIGGLVLLQLTPRYEATSLVIVDPRPNDIFNASAQNSLVPPDIARVTSEVEILKSPVVLVEAIRKLNLTLDAEFGPRTSPLDWVRALAGSPVSLTGEETLQETLKHLVKAVSVDRRRGTYVIAIDVQSESPEKAARIANEIADSYIDLQIQSKIDQVTSTQRALQAQLGSASATLQRSEARIDSFIDENVDRISDPSMRQALDAIRQDIDANRREQTQLQNVAERARKMLSSRSWDGLVAELKLASLDADNRARLLAEAKLAEVGRETPQAIDLRARLAEIEQKLTTETSRALTRLDADVEAKQADAQQLRDRLRRAITSSDLPRNLLVRLYEIQQEADSSRNLYQALLGRVMSVGAQRDLQMPDSRIVSPALPPADPAFPRKTLMFGGLALAALFFAFGVAYLRENYVGGLTEETQVAAVLGASFVAAAPKIAAHELHGSAEHTAAEVVLHPISPYSEAMRRVRLGLDIGLQSQPPASGGRVVLVTSTLPNEGKTQTAVSLARSLALSGKSVLLVDGDLRRPSVGQETGIQSETGLGALLSANVPLASDAVDRLSVPDSLTKAKVLLGFRSAQSPDDVLYRRDVFKAFVRQATEQFDFVIFDSSPLLPIVDARLLVPFANAVVFVVRWAKTRQGDARTAMADITRLTNGRGPTIAVLNLVEGSSTTYGYAYGYGGQLRGT